METLDNGVSILYNKKNILSPAIEVLFKGHGSLKEYERNIIGLQHLIEHNLFSTVDLNISLNGVTTENYMGIELDVLNEKHVNDEIFKRIYKSLKDWLNLEGKDKYINLTKNIDKERIKVIIEEINNEYIYHTEAKHPLPFNYFLYGNDAFSFCGNKNTFDDIDNILNALRNYPKIYGSDIILLLNQHKMDQKQIVSIINLFKYLDFGNKKNSLSIKRTNLFGNVVQFDNSIDYRLIIYVPVAKIFNLKYIFSLKHILPNLLISYNHELNDVCFQFFFPSSNSLNDMVFLLKSKKYDDLFLYEPYDPYFDSYDYYMGNYLGFNFKKSKMNILNEDIGEMKKIMNLLSFYLERSIITYPRDENLLGFKTKIDEYYNVSKYMFSNDYIYDGAYIEKLFVNSELHSHIEFYGSLMHSKCFNDPQDEYIFNNYQLLSNTNDILLDSYVPLLFLYLTNDIHNFGNQMITSSLLQFFDKILTMQTKKETEILLPNKLFKIKTRYNFVLFFAKFKKSSKNILFNVLRNFQWNQKRKGHIYYIKYMHKIFGDYNYMAIFSNPDETKIKIFYNELNNLLDNSDIILTKSCIISTKSDIYDFSALEKKIVVTFP